MPGTTPRGYDYPLYGDTQNFPAQIQALATDIDADVQGLYTANQAARNAPTARVTSLGGIAVATGVEATVTFDTEMYDNASMVNLGANNQIITITQAGVYVVSGYIRISSAVTGAVALFLRSVGGLVPDIITVTKGLGSPDTRVSAVAVTRCNAAETIRIVVRQNSGAGLTIEDAGLSVTKVAP